LELNTFLRIEPEYHLSILSFLTIAF